MMTQYTMHYRQLFHVCADFIQYTLLSCMFLCATSASVQATPTITLTKTICYQGIDTDQIIFYFDSLPICIQQPRSRTSHNAADHTTAHNQTELVIMLPTTHTPKQAIRTLDAFNKVDPQHTITVETITKPVKGSHIIIRYNPHTTYCSYGHNRNGEMSYIVAFHKKHQHINTKPNTSYRVLLTSNGSSAAQRIAQAIAAQLKKEQIEVVTMGISTMPHEQLVSYANCVVKPDFAFTITHDGTIQIEKPLTIVDNSTFPFLTRTTHELDKLQENRTAYTTQTCTHFARNLTHNLEKEGTLTYAPTPAKSTQSPYGIEAPGAQLIVNTHILSAKEKSDLASSCAQAITTTLNRTIRS